MAPTLALGVFASLSFAFALAAAPSVSEPIPPDQIGMVAGRQPNCGGLSVSVTPEGARLECVFQKLEGQATSDGLWLTSTTDPTKGERFRVLAVEVGRGAAPPIMSAPQGKVEVADDLVRFNRPGLIEEYSVSVDGVRQDFVVLEPPPLNSQPSTLNRPAGPLRVELSVTGARVEARADGARLVLEGSGRQIAYNRLRATDATGKELPARFEVPPPSAFSLQPLALCLLVDDSAATYPIRVDPTFSDDNWISMGGFPGANDLVRAAVTDAAGNLYIGGDFIAAGNVIANRVAKWDGTNWSALGSGLNSTVTALAVLGSDLYAGGRFTTAGGSAASYIAKWDGTSWSPLGLGVSGYVNALAVSGNDLYVGGGFAYATNAGASSVQVNCIAQWNGINWSSLGLGVGGGVRALAVSGSDLYVGGSFSTAGGKAATNVAQWNGTSWSPLGSGVGASYSSVNALAVSGNDLYVGGYFSMAGGKSAAAVAKWNGSSWSALGSGVSGNVNTLAVSQGDLYVGGTGTSAGGSPASAIAKWNGTSWSALGSGLNNYAYALAVSGSDLYVGGAFTAAGGGDASRIAKWDGTSWSSLGSGQNTTVYALAVSGGELYAGAATVANFPPPPPPPIVQARGMGKWDGSSWSDLGLGLNGTVYALAMSGSNLYAGGSFTYVTNAGPSPVQVNCIAKWNGSRWSALGAGVAGGGYRGATVYALAVLGSELYVGGLFTQAGDSPANNIARWDGSRWSALGSGVAGDSDATAVYALAASGGDVYVGGYFTRATNEGPTTVAVNGIAKWDGVNWSALGSGVGGSYVSVYALAVSGGDLYAGGDFAVAKWDGRSWSDLGSGIEGSYHDVYALAVSGSDLYAGGRFTTAGGSPANNIAKWDGSSWSPLGTGVGGSYPYVKALAVSGTNLFAGGNFTTAGGKVSAYLAKANINAAGGRFTSPAWSPAPGFSCIFRDGTPGEPYLIQTSPSLAPGSWTDLTNFTYTAPVTITDPSPLTSTTRYYRAAWKP